MRALIRAPGGVVVADQPDPQAGAREVVVAVHSCGICGSDVHMAEAGAGTPGSIPGHEFSGTIVALDPAVNNWRVGQPVVVNPLAGCGTCEFCAAETLILCRNRPNLGLNAPGGFAEFVVAHESQLLAVPDGMNVELGARVEPLAVGLRAIAEANPAPGDNALVFGVGPIGLSVIMGLRASGAGRIIAVGRSSAGRRAAAGVVGADVVLDSRQTDVAEYVKTAGVVISQAYECSGDAQALLACQQSLRPLGTLVGVALGGVVGLDLHLFVGRGQRLVSACAYGHTDFRRALELIASGTVDVRPLISERVALSAAPDAFVRLRHPGSLVSVLVQPWLG